MLSGLCIAETPEQITETQVHDFDSLCSYADQVLSQTYAPEPPLDPLLAGLNYEQYRDILFRHDRAIWTNGTHPFWLEFFHRGFVQKDRVDVFTVSSTDSSSRGQSRVQRIEYSPDYFHYQGQATGLESADARGFAGLRVAGRFAEGSEPQELLTFVGSSYFRTRTAETVYGASARGIAVNIGLNQEEEFPDFRALWVLEPEADDRSCRVLALLDGPSIVGAYQFTLFPGPGVTRVGVQARIRLRKDVKKLGLAPLTSMWMWGDGLQGPPLDQRPHVHDSDGLLLLADGRWTWRTLSRLPYPSVSNMPVKKLTGFGLMQRNRNFKDYQDSNAQYDCRPSVWVMPHDFSATGVWNSGRIELLELPGAHEGIDNIGAYFVPDVRLSTLEPIQLAYDLVFCRQLPQAMGIVSLAPLPRWQTKRSSIERDIQPDGTPRLRCKVWFDSASEIQINGCADGLHVHAEVTRGRLIHASILDPEEESGDPEETQMLAWAEMEPTEDVPVEVRCWLANDAGEIQSEVFTTIIPIDEPEFVYPAVYTRQE
ncbi:MAG: glucan biosynthesis protein [Planctomycetota bacterium]